MKEAEVSGFIASGGTEVGRLTFTADIVSVVTLRYVGDVSHAVVLGVTRVTNLSRVGGFIRVSAFFSVTDPVVVVNCWIGDFNSPVAITVQGGGVHLRHSCWGSGAGFGQGRSQKRLSVALCGVSRNGAHGYRFAVRRRGGVASVGLVCELGGGRGGAAGRRRAAGVARAAGVVVRALRGQHVTWTGMGGASRVSHRAVWRGRGAGLGCYFLIGWQFE